MGLKIGHDYHNAQAVLQRDSVSGRQRWHAVCHACDFMGPARDSRVEADSDAFVHDTTENGD